MILLPESDDEPAIPTEIAEAIVAAGRRMDQRNWVPAAAGNISVRLENDRLAITRSGVHKGLLEPEDVMAVSLAGASLSDWARPSAETPLHCQIYRAFPQVGAVVHGHSVTGTVLTMAQPEAAIQFAGYEMLKAFAVPAHGAAALPVVDNEQDTGRLAALLAPILAANPIGYAIRGHGTYVWARDLDTALARFEALEFLMACDLARRTMTPGG